MDYLNKIHSCYFKNARHKSKFQYLIDLMASYYESRKSCPQYLVAVYILAAINKDYEGYIGEEGIDFPRLLEDAESWSSSEKRMAQLACTLFNTYMDVGVNALFYNLDAYNYCVVMQAINFIYDNRAKEFKVVPYTTEDYFADLRNMGLVKT